MCRHVGLTARYIAGLLGGEGATHAWVEVYHNERWIGLDPTHNRMVDDNYITIAHGRDYRDCMLDIGIFSGCNVQQHQWVNASVREQELQIKNRSAVAPVFLLADKARFELAEGFALTRFRGVLLRPLGHLSIVLLENKQLHHFATALAIVKSD